MATTTRKKRSSSSSSKKASSSSGASPGSSSTPANRFKDWPKQGGVGAQPWDPDAHGADTTPPAPGETKDMPVRPGHDRPVLASGAGGDAVRELGRRLGELGYPSSVTDGTNPFNIFDRSLEDAFASFCRDYDVQEDPSGFGGNNPAGVALAAQHVGPWGWEAVIRASDREREKS